MGILGGGSLIGGRDQNSMEMLTFTMFFNAVSKQNKEMRGPAPLHGPVAEVQLPASWGDGGYQCLLDGGGAGGGANTHPGRAFRSRSLSFTLLLALDTFSRI